MTIPPCYIGCDISKAHLDLFDPRSAKLLRVRNTPETIAQVLRQFTGEEVFFIYEATGWYDRALRFALAAAGIPGHRVNPMAARRFAQATGRKAKTDALDARMLADLGRRLTPVADPAPCPHRERLAGFHKRRDQLVAIRAMEKKRREEAEDETVRDSITCLIETLTAQIDSLAEKIRQHLSANQEMRRAAALLQTAPGVGPVTVTTLLALMPELGAVSPKAIASLAGLAPFNHDSGKLKGKRCIAGGRRRVRQALYMAALAAIRKCQRYRTFYENICKRNSAKKVALIAVARKLLVALNAMIRDQKSFA